IGRTDLLQQQELVDHWKGRGLDFTGIFYKPEASPEELRHTQRQQHPIEDVLDRKLIEMAGEALEERSPVRIDLPIRNVDRSTGAMLSGEVARRYGHAGLPDDTISVNFTGTAGQSFAAFLS